MHVVGGRGDILGSVRDDLPRRMKCKALSDDIGPGFFMLDWFRHTSH